MFVLKHICLHWFLSWIAAVLLHFGEGTKEDVNFLLEIFSVPVHYLVVIKKNHIETQVKCIYF